MLIKSSLASILKLFLSQFTIPVSMANLIKKCFHNYLWNDEPEHRKYHLINWKLICHPI